MELTAIAISVPVSFMYVASGLIINLIQAALFLTIRPLSKNTYRRINGAISEILWLVIVWILEWWAGLEVKLYTDLKTYLLMGKEHALVMPNHLSDLDTFFMWILAQRSGCLRSALTVLKKSSKYLPIFGWATWFSEFVFVDRSWAKDEKKLKESFQALKDFPTPFWLTIFTEGTRLTPDKLLQSQEFALSKGLNIPKNVLIPRKKGFVAAIENLRSFVPAIYDVTIAIPKSYPTPSLFRILKRESTPITIHIKRYSMKQMPESTEEIAQWCIDRFSAKDAMLEKFHATGTLVDEEFKEFSRRSLKPLITVMILALIFSTGGLILLAKYSLLSSWRGIGILAFGLVIMALSMHILIEYTKFPPQKKPQL
ncbi:1-acyl-sn-glycerol-3-phosphate acyltransferase PLS1-like [Pistacia vera]|uniref:1-acyl-sn-glycerol-3-phosphate acyltransferase PLS1-like n=1 Tax=Pistacia vera TaxID=55513 RepID=UPI00126380C7|nr:1-acyl-sn-glycerol-3-phosphate acyltransferase PLS1-like [Pistacia vera]